MAHAQASSLGDLIYKTKRKACPHMGADPTQQLYAEMQMLESQYASLSQQESMLGNAYREAESAAATMRAAAENAKIDTLVPVGSGVFFGANISDSKSVVLNIGAGVAIRKDIAYAMNYIELRIKELNVALANAAGHKQEIAARIQQGREEFERMSHPAAGPARGNV